MVRSVRGRLAVALSLSLLAIGALAAPTSAAVHTRWVDDDSKKGDGPAACDTAHFHTIQAAVDASSAGDQVFVCPGTYAEQVIIDTPDLLVQAKPTRTAKIVPPDADEFQEVENGFDLVDILADGVSVVGFKMNIPAGDLGPGVAAPTCFELDSAVYADASNVTLKANSIKAIGDNTLSGECGYDVGIGIVNNNQPPVASNVTGFGHNASDVSGNRIKDFKFAGVILEGELSAHVYNNAIRYVHENDPATCVLTPVLGVNPDLTFPCAPPDLPRQGDSPFGETAGVLVIGGSLADVHANSIYSTFDFDTCEFECSEFLSAGIALIEYAPGTQVRNNRVDNAFVGVQTGDDSLPVRSAKGNSLPSNPDGALVSGNRVDASFVGFDVGGVNDLFYGNRAHSNFGGAVVEGQDNTFQANDFRINLEGDCIDETTGGTGTDGTDNNWDALNLGNNNNPEDICLATEPI